MTNPGIFDPFVGSQSPPQHCLLEKGGCIAWALWRSKNKQQDEPDAEWEVGWSSGGDEDVRMLVDEAVNRLSKILLDQQKAGTMPGASAAFLQ